MDAAVAAKSGGVTGVVAAAAQAAGMNGGERRSRFQRICVYCGSAKGRKPSYQDAAVELGNELVRPSPPRGPSTLSLTSKNPAFTVTKIQSFRLGESPPPGLVSGPRSKSHALLPSCLPRSSTRLRLCARAPVACAAAASCGGDTAAAVAHAARPVLG